MFKEVQTGTNLPAQIEIFATDGDAYKFLFIAKGGGSANKSFLFQATPSILTHDRMVAFLKEKVLTLGTAACPPYHLAIVIGGTSGYVRTEHHERFRALFPAVEFVEIAGAGHWVHAERPREFHAAVTEFLTRP